MGKTVSIKTKMEMSNGQKMKAESRGILLLLDKGDSAGIVIAGSVNPAHLAEAMLHHAGNHVEGSDIMRDLVANILLLGSQDRDLLDEARFTAETMALLQSVLDEGGDEDE